MFQVNDYFGGDVKSIGFQTVDGPATIGVMAQGDYEFGTSSMEIMKVITGKLIVKLPDAKDWKDYKPGEVFSVAAGKKFQVKVEADSSYLCFYR